MIPSRFQTYSLGPRDYERYTVWAMPCCDPLWSNHGCMTLLDHGMVHDKVFHQEEEEGAFDNGPEAQGHAVWSKIMHT